MLSVVVWSLWLIVASACAFVWCVMFAHCGCFSWAESHPIFLGCLFCCNCVSDSFLVLVCLWLLWSWSGCWHVVAEWRAPLGCCGLGMCQAVGWHVCGVVFLGLVFVLGTPGLFVVCYRCPCAIGAKYVVVGSHHNFSVG